MKKYVLVSLIFLFPAGIALAQMDLSTPGGQSVLATFVTNPSGAQVYISGTFVGTSPVSVRLNSNTPTQYRIESINDQYQNYADILTLVYDATVNVVLGSAIDQEAAQISISQPATLENQAVTPETPSTQAEPSVSTRESYQLPLILALATASLISVTLLVMYLRTQGKLRRYSHIRDIEAEKSRLEFEARQAAMQKTALIEDAALTKEKLEKEKDAKRVEVESQKAQLLEDATATKERIDKEIEEKRAEFMLQIEQLRATVSELKLELSPLENEYNLVEHGLYEPLYAFESLEKYEHEINETRQVQKSMIQNKTAVHWHTEWTVEGSRAKGKQMENQLTRLMLRAFNGECDALITKVRYNTVHQIEKRIAKLYAAINKLGKVNNAEMSKHFLHLKLNELHLVHEFQERKQQELEEQRQIREQLREEERARREIERAIMEAEKEEDRYTKALEKARLEVLQVSGKKQLKLEADVQRLQELLAEAHTNRERAKSRAEMTRSGYIYIISNIGSFGQDVYKIGMTRRLDPMDRVYELGDASVPFTFDVHAMIFSEDAPKLESALHRKFDHRRVNRINFRKEFFRVSLEEIREEALKHKADIHFTLKAKAEDFMKTTALLAREVGHKTISQEA